MKPTYMLLLLLTAITIISGDENGDYFRNENPDAYDAWASPESGVWLYTAYWGPDRETWSDEQCKKAIDRGWGKSGILKGIKPILTDRKGAVWFLNINTYATRPYIRFDGKSWWAPDIEEAHKAVPRVRNPGGPRYKAAGLNTPDGTVILFEDLGALAVKDGKAYYASFFNYTTCDFGQPDSLWPDSVYLRNTAQWVIAPDGCVYAWARPDSRNQRHIPEGVMNILKWDGKAWQVLSHFRGMEAERLVDFSFFPNGAIWALVTPANSSKSSSVPVYLGLTRSLPEADSIRHSIRDEKGEALYPWAENPPQARKLFQQDDRIYVILDKMPFVLLPRGGVERLPGNPWDQIAENPVLQIYDAGQCGIWLLLQRDTAGPELFHWDTHQLTGYTVGLGRHIRAICGYGPDNRLYLRAGEGETFVVSILPGGEETHSRIQYTDPPAGLPKEHAWDDKGRITAWWGEDYYVPRDSTKVSQGWLRFPWPATHVFTDQGWKEQWLLRKVSAVHPPKPGQTVYGWHVPRPRNLLEKVSRGREVKQNAAREYKNILQLLREPYAAYYRHAFGYFEPGFLYVNDGYRPWIYNGEKWLDVFALMQCPESKIEHNQPMFLRGQKEIWHIDPDGIYRCLAVPAKLEDEWKLKYVIKPLKLRLPLGLDGNNMLWSLGLAGPRIVGTVKPEKLEGPGGDTRLCGVDIKGRVYFQTVGVGKFVVKTETAEWEFSHRAFASRNHTIFAAVDLQGRIWCSTPLGLMVFAKPVEDRKTLQLLGYEPRGSHFNHDCPVFDRYGNLWQYSFSGGWRVCRKASQIEFAVEDNPARK